MILSTFLMGRRFTAVERYLITLVKLKALQFTHNLHSGEQVLIEGGVESVEEVVGEVEVGMK